MLNEITSDGRKKIFSEKNTRNRLGIEEQLEAFNLVNKEGGVFDAETINENLARYFLGVYLRNTSDSSTPINASKLIQYDDEPPTKNMLPILKDLEAALSLHDINFDNHNFNYGGASYSHQQAVFIVSELLHFSQLDSVGVSRQYYYQIVELAFKKLFPEIYNYVTSELLKIYNISDIDQQDEVVSKFISLTNMLAKKTVGSIDIDVRGRHRRPAGVAAQILQKNIKIAEIDDNISLEIMLLKTPYNIGEALCRRYGDDLSLKLSKHNLAYVGRDDFRIVPTGSGYAGVHYYFKYQNKLSVEIKWVCEYPRPQKMTKAEYARLQQDHFRRGLDFNLDLELSKALQLNEANNSRLAIDCFNISLKEFRAIQTILTVESSHFEISFGQDTIFIRVTSAELKESLERSSFLKIIEKNSASLNLIANWKLISD